MATARKVLVDPEVTSFYHCISRCVRRAFLCGAENAHRKKWIEDRLQELVRIFAIDVCGFAILDNHLHVLLRLDLAKAKAWSAHCSARAWTAPRSTTSMWTCVSSRLRQTIARSTCCADAANLGGSSTIRSNWRPSARKRVPPRPARDRHRGQTPWSCD